ncbi:MAG: hypothetical protein Kow0077_09270 [Anaerolineae bacterium]
MTDPLIGTMLGDYQIVAHLGQGGMARIYKGYDPKLQRYAAVKVFHTDAVPDDLQEEYEIRFIREARAIARLQHPNIVGVYQFDQMDGLHFMAMQLIPGQDLRQVLVGYYQRGEVMPDRAILNLIRDIASALDYAHAQGVVHRDVKPSNIMVTPEGTAILTDFGLALSMPEGTVGRTFGSAHYIAPEQAISSAQAVPQSDLYSLGVVLFEMATGRVPFDDPSTMSVALMHLNDPPPLPSSVNPAINPGVEQVILKLLRKDPADRYPTGAAVIEALEAAIQPTSQTIPLQPPTVDPPLQASPELYAIPAHEPETVVLAPSAPGSRSRRGCLRGVLVLLIALIGGGVLAWQSGVLGQIGGLAPILSALPAPGALFSAAPDPSTATPSPASEATAGATTRPTSTLVPTPLPPSAPSVPGAEPAGELLLRYDADSVTLTNQSNAPINIEALIFRLPTRDGMPPVFFAASDLDSGVEPPSALQPGHCFHIWRMDRSSDPEAIPYDQDACQARVGWRIVSPPRWFWITDGAPDYFEVVAFDRIIGTCVLRAGQCGIDLP